MLAPKQYWISFIALVVLMAATRCANAEKQYDAGASDFEIRIGNIMPYSGPASAYGIIGRTMKAFFQMVNDNGGINGRRINFISYDDAYSPSKTMEQARRLVEDNEVLAIFAPFGTASNAAIQRYMNNKRVPQLFVISGASRWGDPGQFPWTMGWQPTYRAEARVYANYILSNHPNAHIGIIYQNDDFGREYLRGLEDVFKDRFSKMVIAAAHYEVGTPTVDSQVVAIKSSAPDVFINVATPKYAAQVIRKLGELNWRPIHILTNVSVSIGAVLRPAGLQNSNGILSAGYQMDVTDAQWARQPGMRSFRSFLDKYYPEVDRTESGPLIAYNMGTALVEVIKRCGDDLSRLNIMKTASDLDLEIGGYIPGVRIRTSPTDFFPIEQLQMMRFNGAQWDLFGPLVGGEENPLTASK